jgi:raffinose/stachyose/melibiose transport system permease protein
MREAHRASADDGLDDDPFRGSLLPRYLVLLLVAGLVLVPIAATVLGGFKDLGELRTNPFGLPHTWHLGELLGHPVARPLLADDLQSRRSSPPSPPRWCWWPPAGGVRVRAPALRGADRYLLNYFLIGLLFPAATAILPLFIKERDLGLLDTYAGVVLPAAAFSLGAAILLFRNFFKQLPGELLDSALIDGATYLQFFARVVLPLSRPILATVGVISFVQAWEQLPAAADPAQQRRQVPLAAGHHGLPGRVLERLAARAGVRVADHRAGGHRVPAGAAVHRGGADGGGREGMIASAVAAQACAGDLLRNGHGRATRCGLLSCGVARVSPWPWA